MGQFSQVNRPMAVTTPLGPDVLLLVRFAGTESLSQLFHFELEMLAEDQSKVEFDQLLGQDISIKLAQPDGTKRYFSGIVNRVTQSHQIPMSRGNATFTLFRAEMVPKLWLLTRSIRSRIFQQKSVPEILTEVLTGLDVSPQIQGTFEPRDYCVQYRESDFAFASRIMEEEGIFYFFQHSAGGSQLVLANTPQSHAEVPGPTTVHYDHARGDVRPDDRITGWVKTQEFRSGKSTLWDHCFELPGDHLEATKSIQESVASGTVTHKLKVGNNDQLEIYDYPGGYAGRFDGIDPGGGEQAGNLQKIFQDNARTVGIRMQEEAARGFEIAGESTCRQFVAGHKFAIDRHFNADGEYVLTRVEHSGDLGETYTTGEAAPFLYLNTFRCIPAGLPYRPARITPRPRIDSTQTAVVVGPAGQEIFTDKYGRVKVQFHWDREGKNDANSSCWVRVGSFWAGKAWGGIHIPRIGHEVIVSFLEGEPDQPLIVGSVYNAENMPPYVLPDNMTQSGVKSRSTLQGTPENFNELRFEDKKGSEQVYFHAEKDFDRVVENNDTTKVGFDKKDPGDQTIEVYNSQTIKVGTAGCAEGSQTITVYKDRTETIETGNETVTIKMGNRSHHVDTGNELLQVKTGNRDVKVDTGNDSHAIKMGNRGVQIDMGNDALTIKMGNQTTKLNLGKSETEAMQSIELKVGQSSLKVDQMGVTIKGMMIKVEGTIQTEVKGLITQLSADAMLMAKGAITMIN